MKRIGLDFGGDGKRVWEFSAVFVEKSRLWWVALSTCVRGLLATGG